MKKSNLSIFLRCFALLFAIGLFGLGCASDKKQKVDEAPKEATPNGTLLASIPMETMQRLFKESDYLDIIFYNSPISVSQNEKGSIQQSLRHVSEKPAMTLPECKPVGRLSYMVNGTIDTEADIYFSEGCQYFVFIENGKPVAGNYMTPDGVNFYGQIMNAKPPGQ